MQVLHELPDELPGQLTLIFPATEAYKKHYPVDGFVVRVDLTQEIMEMLGIESVLYRLFQNETPYTPAYLVLHDDVATIVTFDGKTKEGKLKRYTPPPDPAIEVELDGVELVITFWGWPRIGLAKLKKGGEGNGKAESA